MSQTSTHNKSESFESEGNEKQEEESEPLEQSEEYEEIYSSESDLLAKPDGPLTLPQVNEPLQRTRFTALRKAMTVCAEIQQIMSF